MKKFLAATLALALSAALQSGLAVGTPSGTTITNTGFLDLNDGVTATTVTSTPVVVNVTQVYGISITPDGTTAAPGQTVTLFPGETGTLTYTLTNTGNGTDTFDLAAAVANATAQGANIVGVYLDNTTGTVGSFDAGDTAITGSAPVASVPADATRTVFIRYTVPSGTTGGSASGAAHQLNISGTSRGDTTKTDTNNVGQLTVGRVIDLTLTSTQNKTVAPNGTITFTDTLTNTGNTTLTAADIAATVTAAATNGAGASITNNFTTTYTVGGSTGTDLNALIDSAVGSGLVAGGTLTITVNVTAPAAPADRDQQALTLLAYSPTTASATVKNDAPSSDTVQGQIVNTAVVTRGTGSVTKTQALCGSSVSACPTRTGASNAAINAKPGEYVVYYLEATNTGTGTLTNVRLRDVLPANFVVTNVGATTSATGTLKFSTDGTTWATTPVGLTLTGGTSTLYVAVENGGTATTITMNDTFPTGSTLRLRIAGYVRSDSTTTSPITLDNSGL